MTVDISVTVDLHVTVDFHMTVDFHVTVDFCVWGQVIEKAGSGAADRERTLQEIYALAAQVRYPHESRKDNRINPF